MKPLSRIVCTLILGVLRVYGQRVDTGFPAARAENAWMSNPLSAHLADSVPATIRQQRDLFFDNGIGQRERLTPLTARNVAISEGSFFAGAPEIPEVENRKLVVVLFASYRPVLTASGRAIYTEVSLVVRDVLDNGMPAVNVGQTITLALPGGAVITDSGEILSFLTQPKPRYISPEKIYLMVLSYRPAGDFYLLGKAWDVSSGFVKTSFGPHQPTESLLGLTVEQVTALLKQRFGGKQ